MKKILLLGILLFSLGQVADAQLIKGFGVKVGMTNANQDYNFNSSSFSFVRNNLQGLYASGFVEFLNVPMFSIVSEVSYEQKGWKDNILVTTNDDPDGLADNHKDINTRFDYLSLAVFAKYRYETRIVNPYLFAGPRLDYLLQTYSDGQKTSAGFDSFKKSVFGISFGLGVETANILPVALLVEVQFNPAFSQTAASSNNSATVKNKSIDFKLGIRL